jgi:DNA-binding PadR family transcriptional regulator
LSTELGHIWHVSLSQAYNILKRLETQGYIRGVVQLQDNLPDRREFHLTEAGRAHFEEWLNRTSASSVHAIRVEFATRLFFTYYRDARLSDELIQNQVDEIRAGLVRLENTLGDLPEEQLFNRLGLELRIRQLSSAIDWLHECRRVLLEHPAEETSDGS